MGAILYFLLLVAYFQITGSTVPCIPKTFGESSIVCVCNSSYCDSLDSLKHVEPGKFVLFTTSKDGQRFSQSGIQSIDFNTESNGEFDLTIHRNGRQYQKIIGFGVAFTDATGENLRLHDTNMQKLVVEQYFGEGGLEFNIGRVPMGGADFSSRPYTYADDVENDVNLEHFNLTNEDYNLKIPYIRDAIELKSNLKLFASVWTAPRWMKTNDDFIGFGQLKLEYYETWANYFIKFLEAYDNENLNFWGISTQNEPLHGIFFNYGFNCMGWTASQQKEWIKNHLGPKLTNSRFSEIKLIMYDDQRLHLKNYTEEILTDPEAAKFISGIGVHWYTDSFMSSDILTTTHYNFPDYFLLGTEACAGAMPNNDPDVILGSWERAVNYASDIITDLNNFVSGWVDWNMLLNMEGGPNWAENYVDAAIISDAQIGVIYKQPMYYALGHFSKFIPEDSVRLHTTSSYRAGVETLTCIRPDGMVTVVMLNRLNATQTIRILDSGGILEGSMEVQLGPKSLTTLVYNPQVNQPISTTSETPASTSSSITKDQLFPKFIFLVMFTVFINA